MTPSTWCNHSNLVWHIHVPFPSGVPDIPEPSRTFPMKTPEPFSNPETGLSLYESILRTILDLLVISRIPSEPAVEEELLPNSVSHFPSTSQNSRLTFQIGVWLFKLGFNLSLYFAQPWYLVHDATIPHCHDTFMYPSPLECRTFRNLLEHSRWKHRNHSRTPKRDFPYMNLILWTIPDHLVISRIPSETPNNIRSLSHNTITTQTTSNP